MAEDSHCTTMSQTALVAPKVAALTPRPGQAEIEASPPSELFELDLAELGDGLFLREIPCEKAPQDVLHRPARTSRILCQWVPAQ